MEIVAHADHVTCSQTDVFGKASESPNQTAALALHFAFYNFCRIHRTLKVTPAMESGITDHVWTIQELLEAA